MRTNWLLTDSGTNMRTNLVCMDVRYQCAYDLRLYLCPIHYAYELGKKNEVRDILLTDQGTIGLTKMAKMRRFWIGPMTAYAGVLSNVPADWRCIRMF